MELVCNSCLDTPTNAVLTSCGHLFCWACLHQWMLGQPKPCPVCRNMLRPEINIIPIYASDGSVGSGTGAAADGTVTPPRPNPPSSASMALAGPSAVHQAGFHILLEEAHEGLRTELLETLDRYERLLTERARVTALQLERNVMEELMAMRRERTVMQRHQNELVRWNVTLVQELEEARARAAQLLRRAEARRRREAGRR